MEFTQCSFGWQNGKRQQPWELKNNPWAADTWLCASEEYSELGTAEQNWLYFGVIFCLVFHSECSGCFWKHLKFAIEMR